HDLIELSAYLRPTHSHDRALEENVLPSREILMEARGYFDERANLAVSANDAGGRLHDPVEDLEDGRFPGAVASDDSENFSRPHVEREISDRPEIARAPAFTGGAPGEAPERGRNQIPQRVVRTASAETLPDAIEGERRRHAMPSPRTVSMRVGRRA